MTPEEILEGAIDILSQEGMWCRRAGINKLGQSCADGALARAAGLPMSEEYASGFNRNVAYQHPNYEAYSEARSLLVAVITSNTPANTLWGYNDKVAEGPEDVILMMKKAVNHD